MDGSAIREAARELLVVLCGDPDEIRRLKRKVNVLIEKLRAERESSDGIAAEIRSSEQVEITRLADELHRVNFDNAAFSSENFDLRSESQRKDTVIAEQGGKLFELQIKKAEETYDVDTLRAELVRERDGRENDARQITNRVRTEFAERIKTLKSQITSRDVELTAVRARNAEIEIFLNYAADKAGCGRRYAEFRLHRLTAVVLDLVSAALAADAAQ